MDVAGGFLILLLMVAPAVYATDYIVGDTSSWAQYVDYGEWTAGKTFNVGDTLLFRYGPTHSVDEVNSSDFLNCSSTSPLHSYTSGNDTIALDSPGTMYFICPTTYHCHQGMKLQVKVAGNSSVSSSPTPTSSSTTTSNSPSQSPSIRLAGNLVLGLGISLFCYAFMG